ncbi:hypothetical protein LZD49_12580 [Dyadobacter sp. CY261]|uniref:hypothetical protein n=1 Tax=Dyadobacter sp. CY261 TaxID=2907203 RepID=UPI001F29ECA3|nr:hypothetical protein [Dyadobacter sp. CY261]MCF0071309.1 hypothetical protein [Dyadobacter sp. CY261]
MLDTTTQTEANPFDLEEKFHTYLVQMGIDRATMPADRYKEMKRTFMHACGKMLALVIDTIAGMPEREGNAAINKLFNQVDRFMFQDIAEEYQSTSGELKEFFTIDPTREP